MGLGQGQPILKQPLNVEPDRLTHRLLRLFSCLARSHTPRQAGGVRGVATVGLLRHHQEAVHAQGVWRNMVRWPLGNMTNDFCQKSRLL